MKATFRNFTTSIGFTDDYYKVKRFLLRINKQEVVTPNFLFGRWEWAFSLPFLDKENLDKIGLWEASDEVVALATFESSLGDVYLAYDPEYASLLDEMISHAKSMTNSGKTRLLVASSNKELSEAAYKAGYLPTCDREEIACLDIESVDLDYLLPEGYDAVSLSEDYSLEKYHSVLWQGFDHGNNPVFDEENRLERINELSGESVNLDLNISVRNELKEFVSYCGIWHDPGSDYALLEPCATVPEYRRKGLGKAAIYEAAKRLKRLGCKKLYVGSGQQFYYSIGFLPMPPEYFYVHDNNEK